MIISERRAYIQAGVRDGLLQRSHWRLRRCATFEDSVNVSTAVQDAMLHFVPAGR
jgi:hypothetical protein